MLALEEHGLIGALPVPAPFLSKRTNGTRRLSQARPNCWRFHHDLARRPSDRPIVRGRAILWWFGGRSYPFKVGPSDPLPLALNNRRRRPFEALRWVARCRGLRNSGAYTRFRFNRFAVAPVKPEPVVARRHTAEALTPRRYSRFPGIARPDRRAVRSSTQPPRNNAAGAGSDQTLSRDPVPPFNSAGERAQSESGWNGLGNAPPLTFFAKCWRV